MFPEPAFPSLNTARWLIPAVALMAVLLGQADCAGTGDGSAGKPPLENIKTIVVIYAENRSFDNLYGLFPGAEGITQALENPASYQQVDRDGKTVLPHLPPVHATHALGAKIEERWAFVGKLPNKPFLIDTDQPGGEPGISAAEKSPDLVHRFYNNQMQIHGGRNDMFAAWSNVGGLTMGYYSGKPMKMWQLALQYTLADHFFMGGFGGSFFNHQYLISASPPVFPDPPKACLSAVDESGTALQLAKRSPHSALDGPPWWKNDVMSGDAHLADVVARLQAGPQWNDMLIIVTYDENGGFFDHVPPPKGDRWGPGTRIPAIIISPFAKKGFVDHTTYDTTSILKLITRRFNLDPLPGTRRQMGDLTAALEDRGS